MHEMPSALNEYAKNAIRYFCSHGTSAHFRDKVQLMASGDSNGQSLLLVMVIKGL